MKSRHDPVHSYRARVSGLITAALIMLALSIVVTRLVIIWCPRGENCEEVGQALFWAGLMVSFALAFAAGLLARDLHDRWIIRPAEAAPVVEGPPVAPKQLSWRLIIGVAGVIFVVSMLI